MKRTVAEAHRSEYPNPISFAAGETVTLGREETDYPGWVWVTTGNGNAGWAPLVYLEIAAGDEGWVPSSTLRQPTAFD